MLFFNFQQHFAKNLLLFSIKILSKSYHPDLTKVTFDTELMGRVQAGCFVFHGSSCRPIHWNDMPHTHPLLYVNEAKRQWNHTMAAQEIF